MNTIKNLIAATSIPEPLVRATIHQFGGLSDFAESAQDIADHGADAGWKGFTYYSDTIAFSKRQRASLIAYAKECAAEQGVSLIEFFGSFRCLKGETDLESAIYSGKGESADTLRNALAWFALEEVARAYVDLS